VTRKADSSDSSERQSKPGAIESQLVMAIDTCGPTGSVALGCVSDELANWMADPKVSILNQIELEGRSYSATLVASVDELLKQAGVRLQDLRALVAVSGPGSFTGVRVGLSAVKGLAEAAGIPIAAVSRLEVLSAKAGVQSSALDAHRSEVFLRVELADKDRQSQEPRELLAGAAELGAMDAAPDEVAVCDDAAEEWLKTAWPSARIVRVSAPDAGDAIRLAAVRVRAGEFVDPVLLDGHYLRRSDAEIFGEPGAVRPL
jgi:tRNA threonylcarbamoyladenosine biosynthesis protein TsaB